MFDSRAHIFILIGKVDASVTTRELLAGRNNIFVDAACRVRSTEDKRTKSSHRESAIGVLTRTHNSGKYAEEVPTLASQPAHDGQSPA